MRLSKLLNSIGDYYSHNRDIPDFEVRGLTCNSKDSGNDFIFVAIKGARADGNRFIREALAKGAKAVFIQGPRPAFQRKAGKFFVTVKNARKALAILAAQFYGNPSGKVKVVGITGTNGKTTISYLLESLLKKNGSCPAVLGTVNYRFRDKVFASKNTTPGPVQMHALLSGMLKEGMDYAVLEVSSHALDQDRTEAIDFHSAIFTNLTQDHLDYHRTLRNYFMAKSRLFTGLSRDSVAVINNDDD